MIVKWTTVLLDVSCSVNRLHGISFALQAALSLMVNQDDNTLRETIVPISQLFNALIASPDHLNYFVKVEIFRAVSVLIEWTETKLDDIQIHTYQRQLSDMVLMYAVQVGVLTNRVHLGSEQCHVEWARLWFLVLTSPTDVTRWHIDSFNLILNSPGSIKLAALYVLQQRFLDHQLNECVVEQAYIYLANHVCQFLHNNEPDDGSFVKTIELLTLFLNHEDLLEDGEHMAALCIRYLTTRATSIGTSLRAAVLKLAASYMTSASMQLPSRFVHLLIQYSSPTLDPCLREAVLDSMKLTASIPMDPQAQILVKLLILRTLVIEEDEIAHTKALDTSAHFLENDATHHRICIQQLANGLVLQLQSLATNDIQFLLDALLNIIGLKPLSGTIWSQLLHPLHLHVDAPGILRDLDADLTDWIIPLIVECCNSLKADSGASIEVKEIRSLLHCRMMELRKEEPTSLPAINLESETRLQMQMYERVDGQLKSNV